MNNDKLYNESEFNQAKYHEFINVTCSHCDKKFLKRKRDLCMTLRNGHTLSCKPGCYNRKEHFIYECMQCHKELKLTKNDLKRREKLKIKRLFCSHKCSAIYYKERVSSNRSKAEVLIFESIKAHFPSLQVYHNKRDILPSKLELDIVIPELKIAIEVNGPHHTHPIHSQKQLKLVQQKDAIKQQEAKQLGYNLIVVPLGLKYSSMDIANLFTTLIKPQIGSPGRLCSDSSGWKDRRPSY